MSKYDSASTLAGKHFHPQALVESTSVGRGTRVWAFAHVLPGAVIGEDCNVCDHVFIENDVVIGDRVTIKCGVQLWDGVTLEDDVFVGPNATFTNDLNPRSGKRAFQVLRTKIQKGATVGANATILPGITVGQNAMIGAGAVVTRDVPPNAMVVGNPARIKGYVDAVRSTPARPRPHSEDTDIPALRVRGAKLHPLPMVQDLRGKLSYGEYSSQLPFLPKRYFIVYDVPSQEVRGAHAHKTLHEFLVCIVGSCTVALDDGVVRDEVTLNSPTMGLHVPPGLWRVHYRYSPHAVLLVLASDIYQSTDYVRDYDEFLRSVPRE